MVLLAMMINDVNHDHAMALMVCSADGFPEPKLPTTRTHNAANIKLNIMIVMTMMLLVMLVTDETTHTQTRKAKHFPQL